jgi:hypothetical protein
MPALPPRPPLPVFDYDPDPFPTRDDYGFTMMPTLAEIEAHQAAVNGPLEDAKLRLKAINAQPYRWWFVIALVIVATAVVLIPKVKDITGYATAAFFAIQGLSLLWSQALRGYETRLPVRSYSGRLTRMRRWVARQAREVNSASKLLLASGSIYALTKLTGDLELRIGIAAIGVFVTAYAFLAPQYALLDERRTMFAVRPGAPRPSAKFRAAMEARATGARQLVVVITIGVVGIGVAAIGHVEPPGWKVTIGVALFTYWMVAVHTLLETITIPISPKTDTLLRKVGFGIEWAINFVAPVVTFIVKVVVAIARPIFRLLFGLLAFLVKLARPRQ